jgi:hypothetical protein
VPSDEEAELIKAKKKKFENKLDFEPPENYNLMSES